MFVVNMRQTREALVRGRPVENTYERPICFGLNAVNERNRMELNMNNPTEFVVIEHDRKRKSDILI